MTANIKEKMMKYGVWGAEVSLPVGVAWLVKNKCVFCGVPLSASTDTAIVPLISNILFNIASFGLIAGVVFIYLKGRLDSVGDELDRSTSVKIDFKEYAKDEKGS